MKTDEMQDPLLGSKAQKMSKMSTMGDLSFFRSGEPLLYDKKQVRSSRTMGHLHDSVPNLLGAEVEAPASNMKDLVNGMSSPVADPSMQENESGDFFSCAVVALLACFMGATDGLSLGSVIFPSDYEHPNMVFKNMGMSLGLLTALVTNLALWAFSDIHFGVGGAIIPMVAMMASTFKEIGPAEPQTILAATGLVSFFTGILFYVSGCGLGVKQLVNSCPAVVFGGFLAGTGATLFDFGFQLLVPGFTSMTDFGPNGLVRLGTAEGLSLIAAPSFFAVLIFLTDRWGLISNRKLANLTLPMTLVAVTLAFYMVLFITGTGLEEARAGGWLFDTEVPDKIDCYRVWSMRDFSEVKWSLIFVPDFFFGIFKSYLIGLLTLTKNVYGTKETTGLHAVDIDKEIRLHGGIGILGGALGALPGNLVMSFTCTAKKLGVPAKRSYFGPLLVFFSVIFFVFGDFIIAVLPKMIPGIVLIWLGIAFCAYWLYDLVGKVPVSEHLVVVLMTVIDLFLDAGTMIIAGLFCTLLIVASRLAKQYPCRQVASLGLGAEPGSLAGQVELIRSHVMRPAISRNCLASHGRKVLILFPSNLTFLACSTISEDIISRLESNHAERADGGKAFEILILMVGGHETTGIHFTSMIADLAGLANKHNFKIILGAAEDTVIDALEVFGLKPPPLMLSEERCRRQDPPNIESGQVAIIPSEKSQNAVTRPYCTVVMLAEHLLLAQHLEQESKSPVQVKTLTGSPVKNSDWMRNSAMVASAGIATSHPAHAVAVAFHSRLNDYDKGYEPKMLLSIMASMQVKELLDGDIIYSPDGVTLQEMAISAGDLGKVPPLIWLISGDLDHIWMGGAFEFGHFREYEAQNGLPRDAAEFQAALVSKEEQRAGLVVGPLSTVLGFTGAMPHVGKIIARQKSTVCLMQREAYDKLMKNEPDTAARIQIYLARANFINGCDPSVKFHM